MQQGKPRLDPARGPMDQPTNHLLETVLQECARVAPAPLYPAQYADSVRIPRGQLDDVLDNLRLGGLVRLTDWVQGLGQGYTLTPAGAEIAGDPSALDRLRRNGVTALPAPAPLRAEKSDERTSPWERGEAVRRALLEPTRPVVTLTLIFANVVMFLVGLALVVQRNGKIG